MSKRINTPHASPPPTNSDFNQNQTFPSLKTNYRFTAGGRHPVSGGPAGAAHASTVPYRSVPGAAKARPTRTSPPARTKVSLIPTQQDAMPIGGRNYGDLLLSSSSSPYEYPLLSVGGGVLFRDCDVLHNLQQFIHSIERKYRTVMQWMHRIHLDNIDY